MLRFLPLSLLRKSISRMVALACRVLKRCNFRPTLIENQARLENPRIERPLDLMQRAASFLKKFSRPTVTTRFTPKRP